MSVLIVIAGALFLVARGVLKRQVVQEETNMPVRAMPTEDFFADPLNEAGTLPPADGRRASNASSDLVRGPYNGSGQVNGQLQWARAEQPTHVLDVSSAQLQSQTQWRQPFASHQGPFATQPLPTEQTSSLAPGMQWSSLPLAQQQAIPSTPTALWNIPEEEEVSDPSLEAMMQQARASLYIIPDKEEDLLMTAEKRMG